ncbi:MULTISPECIES: ribonuclease III [Corynebacterium]|uniref:Ribonuclease 3 n=1 Tax=Corynebacterium stationis TaxID=1705 RepID=A0A177I888_9CORY|nr:MULTISPECIES: ribonuclease III [Corynebacterium]APT94744.1 ribonuclease III [Corynebacterium stationis]MDN6136466.1 ribonuclease III [Corynebacterium sp.]MDN6736621.1 ribonuclease III [Corynebacterium sp.]NME88229.1 ribonuclease III [Corynebacterium stationis]NWO17221.1 ribonuclease III [Corynebacterium sp.]
MSRKKKISGEQALEEAFAAIDTAPLLASLDVELDESFLRLALTHRSFANEHGHLPNNERLEFLGDAVLGLSIAARLYEKYPTRPESDISKMRASIVSRFGLADIAREMGLGAFILLGKGEANSNGRDKDSILADTTEALFGAIYLQHGFETARRVILALFAEKVDAAVSTRNHMDWKTSLQELCAERKLPTPEYSATSTGPEHNQVFTAQVHVDGQLLGEGVGPNKKQAEQQAAEKATLIIRVK